VVPNPLKEDKVHAQPAVIKKGGPAEQVHDPEAVGLKKVVGSTDGRAEAWHEVNPGTSMGGKRKPKTPFSCI
jgi:hypothetical protein